MKKSSCFAFLLISIIPLCLNASQPHSAASAANAGTAAGASGSSNPDAKEAHETTFSPDELELLSLRRTRYFPFDDEGRFRKWKKRALSQGKIDSYNSIVQHHLKLERLHANEEDQEDREASTIHEEWLKKTQADAKAQTEKLEQESIEKQKLLKQAFQDIERQVRQARQAHKEAEASLYLIASTGITTVAGTETAANKGYFDKCVIG